MECRCAREGMFRIGYCCNQGATDRNLFLVLKAEAADKADLAATKQSLLDTKNALNSSKRTSKSSQLLVTFRTNSFLERTRRAAMDVDDEDAVPEVTARSKQSRPAKPPAKAKAAPKVTAKARQSARTSGRGGS